MIQDKIYPFFTAQDEPETGETLDEETETPEKESGSEGEGEEEEKEESSEI